MSEAWIGIDVAKGWLDVAWSDAARVTLGLPREIVKLCDLALVRAYTGRRKAVALDDVRVGAAELHLGKE